MAMNTAFLDALALQADVLISHIGLANSGAELAGGAPAYARQAVTWTAPSAGLIAPTGNLTFNVASGSTVNEWHGWSALTVGTDYGGASLTPEVYGGQGTYTLLAASTNIDLNAA